MTTPFTFRNRRDVHYFLLGTDGSILKKCKQKKTKHDRRFLVKEPWRDELERKSFDRCYFFKIFVQLSVSIGQWREKKILERRKLRNNFTKLAFFLKLGRQVVFDPSSRHQISHNVSKPFLFCFCFSLLSVGFPFFFFFFFLGLFSPDFPKEKKHATTTTTTTTTTKNHFQSRGRRCFFSLIDLLVLFNYFFSSAKASESQVAIGSFGAQPRNPLLARITSCYSDSFCYCCCCCCC